jgi:hypothetical protein
MNTHLLLNCLAALEKKLDWYIEWNFGRCPNDEPLFDVILDKRNSLLEALRKVDPTAWQQYGMEREMVGK